MLSREEFASCVKDALANLYSPAHLQTSPLADLLALQPNPWGTTGERLRAVLRETIALLKPPASLPIERSEWLSYQILWLHYVRLLNEQATCRELNISEATYYRYQREGLDALVSILWERCPQCQAQAGEPFPEQTALLPSEQARARAIALLSTASRVPIDLVELLEGVREIILPLAGEQGVALRLDTSVAVPSVYGEPSVFRQIFVSVLAECIRTSPGSTLELGVQLTESEMIWQLRGLARSAGPAVALEDQSGYILGRDLLGLVHGRLWVGEDVSRGVSVFFAMPVVKPKSVLVIDDDPATVNLYRRYLQAGDYAVLESRTAEQMETLLARARPDIVLLDLMIPRVDGWAILQALTTRPETAGIPVIVCSVIDEPSLALSLGASAVLVKPISQESLLEAIRWQLDRGDTTG